LRLSVVSYGVSEYICRVLSVVQSQSVVSRHSTARPPLQASLSLPIESFNPVDHVTGESALPRTRLPAPKLADRRSQSFGESTAALYQQGLGADCTSKPQSSTGMAAPARYKTELCRPFEENGTCRYGSKCQFAHGKAELRSVARHPKYKTDLCRTFHTTGLCPYGPRCHFIHNDDERHESSSDQRRQQLTAVQTELYGRRAAALMPQQQQQQQQHGLVDRPRLQRHYSDCQPRGDLRQRGFPVTPGDARVAAGAELHRRVSSLSDAVIHTHRRLHTVPESDPMFSNAAAAAAALNINTAMAIRSLHGSLSDSSPASSITDSPSPSPTTGVLLPAAVEETVVPTTPVRHAAALPTAWSGEDDHTKAALLAEIVSRLRPQGIAALISALQANGPTAGTPTGNGGLPFLPRGVDGNEMDAAVPLWPLDVLTQYGQHQHQHHCQNQQQQPQQRSRTTSNIC